MTRDVLIQRDGPERREDQPVKFTVEGGIPLKGDVTLPGAKNSALQAIAIATLTDDRVTFENFPMIGDTQANLSIIKRMGAKIEKPSAGVVSISARNITEQKISKGDSARTTGSRYFISTLARKRGRIIAGPPGGDHIGAPERFRFRPEDLMAYERIGIGSREVVDREGKPAHEFFELPDQPTELRLEERFFGPTINALLSFAGTNREFKIINPNCEPEVDDTIKILNSMGTDIEYVSGGNEDGEDFIHIRGSRYLHGAHVRIKSDPNAMASYASMALITNGDVVINGIDFTTKTRAFMNLLMSMNADFQIGGGILHILPSQARLKPVHLQTDIWPAEGFAQCHTDWQQLLTPVLATLDGTSFIDENVYPKRFTEVEALNLLGARLTPILDPTREQITRASYKTDTENPHTLRIDGPTTFHSAPFVYAPEDVRGATSVLIAALSAKGRTEIHRAEQVLRGLENVDGNLRSLGANISRS